MTDSTMFSMRFPRELKTRLDQAATLDQRSLASLLLVISKAWLKGRQYEPSFDREVIEWGSVEALRADLRPLPGRPRSHANPRLNTDHVAPAIRKAIEGKDRLTLDDVAAAAGGNRGVSMKLVRELLFRDGWREFRNAIDEKVWIKLSD